MPRTKKRERTYVPSAYENALVEEGRREYSRGEYYDGDEYLAWLRGVRRAY